MEGGEGCALSVSVGEAGTVRESECVCVCVCVDGHGTWAYLCLELERLDVASHAAQATADARDGCGEEGAEKVISSGSSKGLRLVERVHALATLCVLPAVAPLSTTHTGTYIQTHR